MDGDNLHWKNYFLLFVMFVLVSSSVFGVIGGGYCIRGYDCEYSDLTVNNLTIIGSVFNVTVINFNVTNDINVQGDVFASDFYGNLDVSYILNEHWVNETREVGNQTFETSEDDVELRLISDSNKHSFLYLMESSIFGFRLWYDGSGTNIFKFDAIDNDIIKPQMWFDRDTADIDFFASVDMNDNNISNIQCLELNSEQICDWNEVNSSIGSGNSSAWSRSGTNVFLTNNGDRVGIGTASPSAHLEIFKDTPELRLTDTGDSLYTRLTRTDTSAVAQRRNYVNKPGAVGGYYIDFDGEVGDDIITIGNVLQYDYNVPFSIGFIIRPDDVNTRTDFINKLNNAVPYNGWGIYFDYTSGNGQMDFDISQHYITKVIGVKTTNADFTAGNRYHVIITYDGSNDASGINIYVDASDRPLTTVHNLAMDGTIANTNDLTFGGRDEVATLHLDGGLDEIVFWDKELSQAEVTADYNGGSYTYHTAGANIDAIYHADTGSGATLFDSGGSGYDSSSWGGSPSWGAPGWTFLPGEDVERIVWKSQDGSLAGEAGILQIGDTDSRLVLEGKTIRFNIGGVEKVQIDADGNIGIGTTTPTSELHVIGDANITGNSYASSFIGNIIGFHEENVTVTVSGGIGSNSSINCCNDNTILQIVAFPTSTTNSYFFNVTSVNTVEVIQSDNSLNHTGNWLAPYRTTGNAVINYNISGATIDEDFTIRTRWKR